MRLLICGSRQWHDEDTIRTMLHNEESVAWANQEEFVVIHGHCPDGADRIADRICVEELDMTPGVDLIREPAQWKRYGRSAGPVRNQLMLDRHRPEVVFAFRHGVKSNGTDDMIRRARKAGLPTRVITPSRVDASRD